VHQKLSLRSKQIWETLIWPFDASETTWVPIRRNWKKGNIEQENAEGTEGAPFPLRSPVQLQRPCAISATGRTSSQTTIAPN
jgi:hypothetical protein